MGGDGVAEELEHGLTLQFQGLCHGQDPLDETEAFFTMAAEGDFPPQDQASQDPLGQVVGWFHPLPADECPQRLLDPQHIGTELGGLPLGTRSPFRNRRPNRLSSECIRRRNSASPPTFGSEPPHPWQALG